MALRPAVFDHNISAFDKACLLEAALEGGDPRRVGFGRGAAEESDHRHRLLLSGGNERQRDRPAKQGSEAPTVHSILLQPTTARKPSTTRHGRGPMGAVSRTLYQSPSTRAETAAFGRIPAILSVSSRMAGIGASRPLPRVSARVPLLNR